MKIQINSIEALERLIGGDTEIEIALRQSVVENFTRRHIKALANSEMIKAIGQAVKAEVIAEFFDTVKGSWNSTEHIFKPEIKRKLIEDLKFHAQMELKQIVRDTVGFTKSEEDIKAELEKACTKIVENITDSNLNYRLDKMVDVKIKERLGIK
jgi:hypothetical protein